MKLDSTILKEYADDRDRATCAVVEGEPLETFKAFVDKWRKRGIYPPCFKLPADDVLEIAIRKMVIHELRAPETTKDKAREWLLSRGYDLKLE